MRDVMPLIAGALGLGAAGSFVLAFTTAIAGVDLAETPPVPVEIGSTLDAGERVSSPLPHAPAQPRRT